MSSHEIHQLTLRLDEFYPAGSERSLLGEGPQACGIRNDRDYERIENAIEEASTAGQLVYRGETDKPRRRMGISVVKFGRGAEGENSMLVKDEIFGPVLPIIPVDDVDSAVRYVNARPTPLALYVCSSNRAVFDKGGLSRLAVLTLSRRPDPLWLGHLERLCHGPCR